MHLLWHHKFDLSHMMIPDCVKSQQKYLFLKEIYALLYILVFIKKSTEKKKTFYNLSFAKLFTISFVLQGQYLFQMYFTAVLM